MRLNKDYTVMEVGDTGFLVPVGTAIVDTNAMMDLNSVSLFIVNALKNEVTLDELIDMVFAEFDADIETIKSDVEAFVSEGKKVGFIEE